MDTSAAMERAIELAALGAGTVLPNPVVGCVLLDPDGSVVGEGYHQRAGQAHAEVHALAVAGDRARGATALVTLEPCNHTGRTGPCSQALIRAGVGRVVVAVRDPNPQAAGGVEALRQAGIEVSVLPAGPLRDRAEDVNQVWLTATRLGRPFVTFKSGMTVDGRVAAPDGTSKWITSAASRADVHLLRARVDTIVVGIGTVLADDPALTVRDADGALVGRQPLRVVVDSAGRTPSTARVLDDSAPTIIATAADGNRVDLVALLADLYRRGSRHVLVEGGPRLVAGFADAHLLDELLLYIAPLLLGAGRPAVEGTAVTTLADAHRLQLREVTTIGQDVRLRYAATPADPA